MRGTFHFQIYGNLQAVARADSRHIHGSRFVDDIELHLLLEAITRDIRLHLGHHFLDTFFHLLLVGRLGQHEDGVAHDQWGLSGIQDNNGLAAFGTTQFFNGVAGGFSELVDIGARARPCRLAGNRGDNFSVVHFSHLRHRAYYGNGGLATAGHHIHVAGILGFQIQRGNDKRADCGRGQIDDLDAVLLQNFVVVLVGTGRCGIEDHIDILEDVELDQALDPLGGRSYPQALGTGQAVGFRVDPNHGAHFKNRAVAHDFNHEVGADIA